MNVEKLLFRELKRIVLHTEKVLIEKTNLYAIYHVVLCRMSINFPFG